MDYCQLTMNHNEAAMEVLVEVEQLQFLEATIVAKQNYFNNYFTSTAWNNHKFP